MARRRGYFAELEHQARLSEQRQRAAARQREAGVRRAEQARKAEERAKLAERVASRQAEAERRNAILTAFYNEVDSLFEATLRSNHYVDLERLRRTVDHPPFGRKDLKTPIPAPPPIPVPDAPVYIPPDTPKSLFGRQQKMAEARARAQADFTQARAQRAKEMRLLPGRRQKLAAQHAAAEENRKQKLAIELDRYKSQCAERERVVAEHNAELDQFIVNLSYGSVEAVQKYVNLVLGNFLYPKGFTVKHEAKFDPQTAELSLRVSIPKPSTIPTIKSYRYVRTSDEITPVALSQKDAKARYLGIVQQMALCSLYTVFEADRRGLIRTIALEVGTRTNDPATGKRGYIPFLAVGASREVFCNINLSGVVPAATLEYLGASISRNPLSLVPAITEGVRRS